MTDENRPSLTADLTSAELLRWYWLKEELAEFARRLGVRATGSKELLTRRIAATLDGVPFDEPPTPARAGKAQLVGPLTLQTVIPRGQRCSQVVRAWFVEQVGDRFSFDAEMRAFFASTDGSQTLQDALNHYVATRWRDAKPIDPQFEFNRFTRAWHETHPSGTHDEVLRGWRDNRARPVDQRGRA